MYFTNRTRIPANKYFHDEKPNVWMRKSRKRFPSIEFIHAFVCHENVMRRWPFRMHTTRTYTRNHFTNKFLTNFPVANHIFFGIHLNRFEFFHKNHHNRNHGMHPVWMNFYFHFSFCTNLINMRLESDWMAWLTQRIQNCCINFFQFFSSSLDAIVIWLEFDIWICFENDWIWLCFV